jgi:hypothetical protein
MMAFRLYAPLPQYDANGSQIHLPAIFAHGRNAIVWLQRLLHKQAIVPLSFLLWPSPRFKEPILKLTALPIDTWEREYNGTYR